QEKLGKKIREAQLHKIPYILVIGDRETAHQNVSVRRHGQQATVEYLVPQLIEEMTDAIKQKCL
ncbi:MAG: His/Gly/Thr/Pro-type tRNA ligase C-terminal domain-containing protein, partial [Lysinibacillus fusiformis]|nr:His/Gly/Thr/Pro-type tRNA ligase C-terminal domain-containing protein [Lysinibacillus fusiformis]